MEQLSESERQEIIDYIRSHPMVERLQVRALLSETDAESCFTCPMRNAARCRWHNLVLEEGYMLCFYQSSQP